MSDRYIKLVQLHDLSKKNMHNIVVALDFDETIAYLTQLGHVYDYLFNVHKKNGYKANEFTFNAWSDLMDKFPECFRPKIIDFLKMLLELRKLGYIDKVIIYTNNNQGKDWINLNVQYIKRLCGLNDNETFLDDIIYCRENFKGEFIDKRRNNLHKTHYDLFSITNLNPSTDRVIFIDDASHPEMKHNSIKIIKPLSYSIRFTKEEISLRYSEVFGIIDKDIYNTMMRFLSYIEQNNAIDFTTKKLSRDDILQSDILFREFVSCLTDILIEIETLSVDNSTSLNISE